MESVELSESSSIKVELKEYKGSHIIREETNDQNHRINYGKVGQIVFNRQL